MSSCRALMATPKMTSVGFSWVDVEALARHAVHLVQTQGDNGIAIAKGIVKLLQLATDKDLMGLMVELNQEVVNVQAFIAAAKAEFGDDVVAG